MFGGQNHPAGGQDFPDNVCAGEEGHSVVRA